jgi:Zn-dependent protease/predicted transcriptional regulator
VLVFGVPSLRIGRILGIPFEVDLSWVVIFVLVALTLATSYYPGVLPPGEQASPWLLAVLGAATALLFFASILAHEVSHAVVAKMQGGTVEKITLFIFGGVASIGEEPASPGRELLMAAAGPGMSVLLAGLSFLGWALTVGSAPWWVSSPLDYLAQINLLVGAFNLLPGFPLDGGRVLHSILWAVSGDSSRSRRWAARSGQVIGGLIAAAAILLAVLMWDAAWMWVGLVGWFIARLAGTSYRQEALRSRLSSLTMEQVMTSHPEYVDGEMTVDLLVREHLLGRQHSRYPVMESGAIIGVVSLADAKATPRDQWPYVRVADITDRALDRLSVDVATAATAALSRLADDRSEALLVVRTGHLVGIVTKSDIIEAMNEPSPA